LLGSLQCNTSLHVSSCINNLNPSALLFLLLLLLIYLLFICIFTYVTLDLSNHTLKITIYRYKSQTVTIDLSSIDQNIFPYIPYAPWIRKISHSIYLIRQFSNNITSIIKIEKCFSSTVITFISYINKIQAKNNKNYHRINKIGNQIKSQMENLYVLVVITFIVFFN